MKREHTVIFDFDGTLVDSFAPGLRIINGIAPEFGFKAVAPHEVDKCRNMTPSELVKFLQVPVHKLPFIVRRLRKDIQKDLPSIKIVNGISMCLHRLCQAGTTLGIVTSNAKENVRACLKRNAVISYFDFLYSSINLFGKHRTIRRVLKKRGIARENVIYVGDEHRDIEAARRCKIKVIAVAWGVQSVQQLRSAGPDFLATDPMQIADYIFALN